MEEKECKFATGCYFFFFFFFSFFFFFFCGVAGGSCWEPGKWCGVGNMADRFV